MDILSPDLLWIENRCYRLPILDTESYGGKRQGGEKNWEVDTDIYDSEKRCYEDDDENDDTCDLEESIEVMPNNRFKLSLKISQAFWAKIVGARGATKKRIESDTKTVIIIPKQLEQGDVVIKGSSKRDIILAKKNIDIVVASSRQKLSFTHFVSVPMNGDEIKLNFIKFKDQVLELCGKDRGVEESIFQIPEKLHLTICALILTNQTERNFAETLLNEVYEKSIKPLMINKKNILMEMKGIEYMNDDPAEVDVLYAKVSTKTGEDLLQRIADEIAQYFGRHKLLKTEDSRKVKLHVTLMNTTFRREEFEELNEEVDNSNRNKWNKKPRRTFNAKNVLEKFHDFYFGVQELTNIQLSLRFSTSESGYYKSSCVLSL